MRSVRADDYEDLPRDVVAIGNDHPAQHALPAHHHRRAQLLYPADGMITVITDNGSWAVPPQRAVWIPAGVTHAVHTDTAVSLRSLYIRPSAAQAAGLPEDCRVVAVSELLRALVLEAVDLPAQYALDGRGGSIMALALAEIARMPALALNTPLPRDPRLLRLCLTLIQAPLLEDSTNAMAAQLGVSRRSFTRLFRRETGMSFSAWRQQACLLIALRRLAAGVPVTRVGQDLGYASPSAFTAVFRRVLGVAPSRYFSAGVG